MEDIEIEVVVMGFVCDGGEVVGVVVWGEGGWFDVFLVEGVGVDEGELRVGEVMNGLFLDGVVVVELVFFMKNVVYVYDGGVLLIGDVCVGLFLFSVLVVK